MDKKLNFLNKESESIKYFEEQVLPQQILPQQEEYTELENKESRSLN